LMQKLLTLSITLGWLSPSIAAVWEFVAVSARCWCSLKERNFLMTAKPI